MRETRTVSPKGKQCKHLVLRSKVKNDEASLDAEKRQQMSRLSVVFISVIGIAGSGWANGQTAVALKGVEADVQTTIETSKGIKQTTPSHYYRSSDGKVREDSMLGPVITDSTAKTVTLLDTSKKEATVLTTLGSPVPTDGQKTPFVQGVTTTIEGFSVTKASTTTPDGHVNEVWTATDIGLGVYVRVQTTDITLTKTLSNIAVHEPDPAVFQIPTDYTVTTKTGPVPPPGPRPTPISPKLQ